MLIQKFLSSANVLLEIETMTSESVQNANGGMCDFVLTCFATTTIFGLMIGLLLVVGQ